MMQQALIEYIVNALWQIPLLAGGAWLLLRVVRPKPHAQYRVWLAVLGLTVLLPLHGIVKADPALTQAPREKAVRATRVQSGAISPEQVPQTRRLRLGETSTRWLVRLYLATVAFSLLRIVRSWLAARHLVAGSQETSLGRENRRAFERYGQRLGITLPQLRESSEVSSPMILRVANPVLLLPPDFGRFTEDEVRAALCHELAHVKRRDYLGNLVCQLVAVPVAWHPVMNAVQRRIRMTREMVCDAMAAREMESPLGYARNLLALARGLLGGLEIAEQAEFPGLFGNNRLEERVMKLMDTTTMSVRMKLARAAGGAVVAIASVATAAMFHVTPTMAESQSVAPQATQTAPVAAQVQAAAPDVAAPVVHNEQPRIVIRKRTPKTAEQARIEKEFQQQTEEVEQDALQIRAMVDSPAFRHQVEEAQRQALKAQTMIDTPEFKHRIEAAQQQALKAQITIDSPEFKHQIEDAKRQALDAQTMIISPDFKRQIEDAKQQALKAQTMITSPDFKRQMEEVKQQVVQEQMTMKQQMEDAERGIAKAIRDLNETSEPERTK